jgi:hypothetical protein
MSTARGFKERAMKSLAFAFAVLLTGCATSNHSTQAKARFVKFQQQSEEISEREQQCIEQAVSRTNEQNAQVGRPDALAGQVERQAATHHEISQCKDAAHRDQAELGARERSEYENEAQQQRDRASLMAILITSHPQ